MPKRILPTEADFESLRSQLLEWGFREILSVEFSSDFKRLDLKAPRPREGRETGFLFFANGLTVRIWTTWLANEGRARQEDAAWVLIAEGDKVPYFGQPIHRTKFFVRNLLRRAWIARHKVLNRPLCPVCNQWMQIARGRAIKSRYWRCSKGHKNLSWDHNIPPRAKRHLERSRRGRARHREKRREQGQPVRPAVLTRRPWRSSQGFQ